jgi:hypothetical protein
MTGPVWWTEGAFVGGMEAMDLQGSIWASWWSAFSLESGLNPFDGSANFFPIGQAPVSQFNILDGLLSAPLIWIFGLRVGFNLACVCILASTAWGMWFLARCLGLKSFPAVVAGLGLECSGFVLHEISSGRPTQAFLVFFLLALAGVAQIAQGKGGRWTPLWTGLCAALLTLTYWYNAVFFGVFALVLWVTFRSHWSRPVWLRIGLAATVALVLIFPFLVQLSADFSELPGVAREVNTVDGLTPLVGSEYGLRAAIQDSEWPLWPLIPMPNSDKLNLSWILLVLGGLGLWRGGKTARPFAVVFGMGWVMALGPFLFMSNVTPTGIHLPYKWVYEGVPFMDRLWWPHRWQVLCAVSLSVLAGLGAASLVEKGFLKTKVTQMVLLGSLIGAAGIRNGILTDHVFIDTSAFAFTDPVLYEGLEGPVISTPVTGDSETGGYVLLSQVIHEQTMNGGLGQHLPTHRPAGFDDWLTENGVFQALVKMEVGGASTATIYPKDVDGLIQAGFRAALVDPSAYMRDLPERWAATYAAFFTAIWGEPEHIAGGGAWWRVEPIDSPVEVPLLFAARPDRRLR